MDEFKLKNFSKFVENFKVKRQQEFPSVEDEVNKVVERLNLSEIKEKLDCAKLKGKELGIFKELSDEEVEKALEKDSAKTKIIESIKKLNFIKEINDKAELAEPELVEDEIVKQTDICGAGGKKTHTFNSVSFTAGLVYLAQLSTKTTPKAPTIEPPINWSPSPEPTESEIPAGAIILARAGSSEVSTETPSSKTITVTSTPQVVVLKNPFTGDNYKYTITFDTEKAAAAKDKGFASALPTSTSVTLNFLLNGRLVITGNYYKLEAWDSVNGSDTAEQHDDLIICGSYNEIDTGKGDDTVRAGCVIDSSDGASGTYNGKRTGLTINTGDGDDYVTLYSYDSENTKYTQSSIDMGNGNDLFLAYNPSTWADENVTNYNKHSIYWNSVGSTFYNVESASDLDGVDGWAFQTTYGGCILYSFLNSLGYGLNNFKLYGNNDPSKDILTVTENNGSYTITFKNYTPPSGKTNTVTLTGAQILSYSPEGKKGATGDFDTKLFEAAINELIKANTDADGFLSLATSNNYYYSSDSSGKIVETDYRSIVSQYIFGSKNYYTWHEPQSGADYDGNMTLDDFLNHWHIYESGMISNLVVSLVDGKDLDNGIHQGHAYAIRNVDEERGYVELVNPHDDRDCLRLSFDLFLERATSTYVFGYSKTEINQKIAQYNAEHS